MNAMKEACAGIAARARGIRPSGTTGQLTLARAVARLEDKPSKANAADVISVIREFCGTDAAAAVAGDEGGDRNE